MSIATIGNDVKIAKNNISEYFNCKKINILSISQTHIIFFKKSRIQCCKIGSYYSSSTQKWLGKPKRQKRVTFAFRDNKCSEDN